MKHKKKFTEMAKQILQKKGNLHNPQIINPVREWNVGLLVALIIFIGSALWSVNVYMTYRNIVVSEIGGAKVDSSIYKEVLVEAALDEVSDKGVVSRQLLETVTPVVKTPALPTNVATTTDNTAVPTEQSTTSVAVKTNETDGSEDKTVPVRNHSETTPIEQFEGDIVTPVTLLE